MKQNPFEWGVFNQHYINRTIIWDCIKFQVQLFIIFDSRWWRILTVIVNGILVWLHYRLNSISHIFWKFNASNRTLTWSQSRKYPTVIKTHSINRTAVTNSNLKNLRYSAITLLYYIRNGSLKGLFKDLKILWIEFRCRTSVSSISWK